MVNQSTYKRKPGTVIWQILFTPCGITTGVGNPEKYKTLEMVINADINSKRTVKSQKVEIKKKKRGRMLGNIGNMSMMD